MYPPPQPEAALTPQHRFVDFFYQAGVPPLSTFASRRIATSSQDGDTTAQAQAAQREDNACVTPHEHEGLPVDARPDPRFDDNGIMRLGGHFGLPHPLEDRYEASILCRYPNTDYADTAFPTYLSMFLFPDDLKLAHSPAGPPAETYHSFIVTEENGNRAYGMCVVMHDRLSPAQALEMKEMFQEWRTKALVQADLEYIEHLQSQLAQIQETILHVRHNPRSPPQTTRSATSPASDTVADAEEKVALYTDLLHPMRDTVLASVDNVYVPRVIGVLSRWPWYDLLRDWLCALIRTLRGEKGCAGSEAGWGIPMERWVVNLVKEVPVPPPGKLELCITVGTARLFCSRPPLNTSSLLQNFSLYPFFRCLSPSHIVTIFELALTERKIIFLSSHTALLNLAAESLCLLMLRCRISLVYVGITSRQNVLTSGSR
ncbi:AEX-3 domain-containing protein [Cladochytrium replicatum]|nr:AEX-3 domain-containing protein [Cladochytrium replicatum]